MIRSLLSWLWPRKRPELLLTADMIVTPGHRVWERETRSKLGCIASARARAKKLRDHRLAFEVAMLRENAA